MKIRAQAPQKRQVTFVYDPDGRDSIKSARLIGSWDENGRHSDLWDRSAVDMKKMEDGTFQAQVNISPSSHPGDWEYGIMADGPAGRAKWAVLEETNPTFRPADQTVVYQPTSIRHNGATRHGNDLRFRYWAPHARSVKAVVWSPSVPDKKETIALDRSKKGFWETRVEGRWSSLEGKAYAYEVEASDGKSSLRVDPYARQRMGPQRGLDDLFLHRETGAEVHKFHPDRVPFTRFEVQEYPKLHSARLVFSDTEGNDLGKERLQKLLGNEGRDLVRSYHAGGESDHWAERVNEDGSIELLPQGEAFAAILPPADRLQGLSYRFEGYDREGNLLGDLDGNRRLERTEARALPFNDPYSSRLDGKHRSQRYGIIEESRFEWRHDDAPREAADPGDQVIYQLHPGSIFGAAKNVDRTSFKEVRERLDYFKDLGVNVLELMPVNSFEGSRDWGYIGSHNMAVSEAYGFVDEKGRWVEGDEALKMFVDAAHSKGFKVYNDVVYNHFGGDYNNVWNVGGPENPWFEWSDHPKTPGESTRQTPWGALPAYNKEAVREYITNHALHQLDEFHFDGLRFDFTHPIHEQGPNGGGDDGWEMLQRLNRAIDFFHPGAFVAAEEFPNHPVVVKPPSKGETGGAGFDSMWNTEFQHRLVHDHHNPSVLQEAAGGQHTRIDTLMNHLLEQPGFNGSSTSVTVVSNHDEVGNADRILNVANRHRDPGEAGDWERGATRTAMGVGLLSPGTPLMFQGEESLATNHFRWGTPSTWDVGWEWMDDPESPRFKHHHFIKDVIRLRKSSDAFDAGSVANRVYSHEIDSVMAFSRKQGDEEYLVVASFNKSDLPNYSLPTTGTWEPVLTSDASKYGGRDRFAPRTLRGENGSVDLPAAGLLVFRRTA